MLYILKQFFTRYHEGESPTASLITNAVERANNARTVFIDAIEELNKANEELAVSRHTNLDIIDELENEVNRAEYHVQQNEAMLEELRKIIK